MIAQVVSTIIISVFGEQSAYSQQPNIQGPTITYRCGRDFEPGAFVGKTYTGTATWDKHTPAFLQVTFNADCTITRGIQGGSPRTDGRWGQEADEIRWEPIKAGATLYSGRVQADGSLRGVMFGRGGYRGSFSLTLDR